MSAKRFCPNCGSRKVIPDNDSFVKRWRNIGRWTCENCGYNGFMPVGNPEDFEFDNQDYEGDLSDAVLDAEFGSISQYYQQISLVMILVGVLLAIVSILI